MKSTTCKKNPENQIDGKHHDMEGVDLAELVSQIEIRLGDRKDKLSRDPDQMQEFWLGVMESVSKATKTADPIPYLIIKGFRKVHMRRRSDGRHSFVAYCKACDKYHTFVRTQCPTCGGELSYLNRRDHIDAGHVVPHYEDADLTDSILIGQFVEQLDGMTRYVAKRWMVDRLDLKEANYCKTIAREVGIGASGVAKHVVKIRKAFQVWYNE